MEAGEEVVEAACIGREQQSTACRWRQAHWMGIRKYGVTVMASVGGVS
jgi:hypothetical protein